MEAVGCGDASRLELDCEFDGHTSPDVVKVHHLLYGLLNEWLASRWGNEDADRSIGFKVG